MKDKKMEKEILDVYDIFKKHQDENFEEIFTNYKEEFEKSLPSLPDGDYKVKILNKLYYNYINVENQEHKLIKFYKEEDDFIKTIENKDMKALFYSFYALHKLNMHESGWDSYDIDKLRELSGIEKLKCEDLPLVLKYGIQLRVSGSKKPTQTFHIDNGVVGKEVSWSCFDDTFKERMRRLVYGDCK